MAKICYILLCHKDPESIIGQAGGLIAAGDCVAIHFDARAKSSDFAEITEAFADTDQVVFAKRVKGGWGGWSLVQGTLNALDVAVQSFPEATHFYLVSGDCMAIKPATHAHRFLDENDKDFIENHDFFTSNWIKTGMKEDRLHYRHWFNERTQKNLFYRSLKAQRMLGLKRQVPTELEVKIGSQWWCLRRRTIESVLRFVAENKHIVRFFKTTWIPDETFFQTLVLHLVPKGEVENRTLTFLMFSDYGMPVTFYSDQYDFLLSQDALFARKISPHATDLKEKLSSFYNSEDSEFSVTGEGQQLYSFLTGRGRHGRRFASRFWEREATIGRERELLIVVCKKWHVAKRFVQAAEQIIGLRGMAYLFDEQDTDLPDLGGIERTLDKRSRHRRAVMRLLYENQLTDRMMICSDPANVELLDDFYSDRCTTRVLEIDCSYDDAYLQGHAIRTGLASEQSPTGVLKRIVPTIRMDFAWESNRLRDRNYPHFYLISDRNMPEANMMQISSFMDITEDRARQIAETPHLFAD